MRKIHKDDEVIVIAGKDKGKTGKVLKILPEKDRAVVEGVQLVKKHIRPNPNLGIEGGVVEKEATIHISNIAILNPTTRKADRVAIKEVKTENGKTKRVRVFKSNQQEVGTSEAK
ncbi:MAG: 50S ribosomal protein L24 [Gammaproteobacteria bacterium]|nr:50S ribosomal protein L24 [Gammaproteobacteria bacterium]